MQRKGCKFNEIEDESASKEKPISDS